MSPGRGMRIRDHLLPCQGCKHLYSVLLYSHEQLDKGYQRLCPECIQNKIQRNTDTCAALHAMLPCAGDDCHGLSHPRENFSQTQLHKGCERLCPECVQKKIQRDKETCAALHAMLPCAGDACHGTRYPRKDFSAKQLEQGHKRLCHACVKKKEEDARRAKKSLKQCGRCARKLPLCNYLRCQAKTPSYMSTLSRRRCDECLDEFAAELARQRERNVAHFSSDASRKRARQK